MSRKIHPLLRSLGNIVAMLGMVLAVATLAYILWNPGTEARDGRHDLGSNAMWLQHGWLGDDGWFQNYSKDTTMFRSTERIQELRKTLDTNHIRTIYPHLAPCGYDGVIAPCDPEQTERFLDGMEGVEVLPWIGGVLDAHCRPEDPQWRAKFVQSAQALLTEHPRLAGVHVNIEPWPSGHADLLLFLEELREALPADKKISLAAYPPPTRWHRFEEVHWEADYYRALAQQADQLAVMMIRACAFPSSISPSWLSGRSRS